MIIGVHNIECFGRIGTVSFYFLLNTEKGSFCKKMLSHIKLMSVPERQEDRSILIITIR